jgi:DNA-binding winged helix-turn-helix (wHTH) protein/Flp pilus assembly protein TadD
MFQLGDWRVDLASGELRRGDERRELEPQTAKLLGYLAGRAGEVVSKAEISEALWPGMVVTEDALSRAVWKLRQALGDQAKAPRYLETLSKRGYRLIAVVEDADDGGKIGSRWTKIAENPAFIPALILAISLALIPAWFAFRPAPVEEAAAGRVAALTARAEDFYAQITPDENEAARRLFEEALRLDPDHAPALAGLANTQIQAAIRWPGGEAVEIDGSAMRTALESGLTETAESAARIERALQLSRRSVTVAPDAPAGYRALGLALAASGDIEAAIEAYGRAVTLDPDAWEALINLGDMHALQGDREASIASFEQAFEAMSRVYESQTARVRPWHSDMGLSIARHHQEAGRPQEAEAWLRRVLYWDPVNAEAGLALASLLAGAGDSEGARAVCLNLPEAEASDCLEVLRRP